MLNEQISSIVGPKSLRISYDELRCGPITASGITSRIHVDSSRDNKSRH